MAIYVSLFVFLPGLLLCSMHASTATIKLGSVGNGYVEDHIRCLHTIKSTVRDPEGNLASWNFDDVFDGFICNFLGVECWHANENRVLDIKLPGMSLEGGFPGGFEYCGSVIGLDLSDNNLTGRIPSDLSVWLPYLVTLDLSQNKFSGPIPPELANCTYLDILHLEDNKLSGEVPWQFSRLEHLKEFDVASNNLSGPIPTFFQKFGRESFEDNSGLCGAPLRKKCAGITLTREINPLVAAAFALYSVVAIFWLVFVISWWRISREKYCQTAPMSSKAENPSNWSANHIQPRRRPVKVCLFEKPVRKMTLADIEKATHNFGEENLMWSGRTGTLYKAWLPDGSLLAVKRLRASSRTAKTFKSEMNTIAHLRHRNLLPLLGYCDVADQEKLLVYKYMANGSLLQCLHGVYAEQALEWATRLKISIGIARGLAWLHHSCNPRVIHRNICSGIVFLDEEYEPRLGGFGLPRLMNAEENRLSISGDDDNWEEEFGYDAPEEWRNPCVATLKGDVYRFGVLLLELITGVRPVHPIVVEEGTTELNLVEWIRYLLSKVDRAEEAIHSYVDQRRKLSGREEEETTMNLIVESMRLAGDCVKDTPRERPSMYDVYQSLRDIAGRYALLDRDEENGPELHLNIEDIMY